MLRTVPRLRLVLPAIVLVVAACTAPAQPSTVPSNGGVTPTAPPGFGMLAAPAAPTNTVWLCRPGLADNPCLGDLTSTAVKADASTSVSKASPATAPPIDCFYVYPTVSLQKGTNANLRIDAEERAVALAQAARFSQVCQVYAPMYPQLTKAAIAKPDSIDLMSSINAYEGVWKAFLDYRAHYNHGRGIVFIGHSQGAFLLTMLLKSEIDSEPATRRLLVSALLMGGNVTVPVGKTVGGDFATIPACESTAQFGCVVAYSSFAKTPPANSLFGRVDSPLSPFGNDTSGSLQVLCVNPASPSGGKAALDPYLPTKGLSSLIGTSAAKSVTAKTPFVTLPGEFTAECKTAGNTTWLQIDRTTGSSDHRPGVANVGPAQWGLHVIDVNIALGNLVDLVRSQAAAYEHTTTGTRLATPARTGQK
jgi:hypothetical protein